MTVRDIRLKWPEAERKLTAFGEIVVTRDSKPVARILPYAGATNRKRGHFDPSENARWLRRFWKKQRPQPATDALLQQERRD